jgi:hypothetical protein
MAEIVFALPVVPGKEELDHAAFAEMEDARREEYEAALRAAGITRHAVWHQETPDGTLALVYMQADDPGAAAAQFGSSDEAFNSWFREQMKEVHGIDISQASPQVHKVHDLEV